MRKISHQVLASAIIVISAVTGIGHAPPAQAQSKAEAVGPTVFSADDGHLSEKDALKLLQQALREQGYEGDVSEEALRREFEAVGQEAVRVNGCSTPKLTKALTKKWDRVFRSACNKHDVCYSKKSRTARKTCDSRFREDMYKICSPRHRDGNACRRAASTYYYAVRAFGRSYYQGKGSRA